MKVSKKEKLRKDRLKKEKLKNYRKLREIESNNKKVRDEEIKKQSVLIKKDKYILFGITLFMILIRCVFLNGETGDYKDFLYPWIENIRSLGGFNALKYNIGDYNVPYVFILTIISYFKCKPLYLIKLVSIVFDFICAIFGYKIVKKLTNNKIYSMITYGILLIAPTVLINSAMWGQCDSIYTSFILMSLYYLLDKKYTKSFLLLGISFAFKLQFIFILPMYVLLYFREKNIKVWHFLLIPLINVIMCLPAIVMGRSFKDVLMIYVNQTGTYKDLVLNFPNLYNLIQDNMELFLNHYELIAKVGVVVTLLIFFIMWLYVLVRKVKFNNEKIITVALWSIVVCTYFLPRMHERYMFVADILSIIWFIVYQKKFHIPVIINVISLLSYLRFLFDYNFINYNLIAIIYFIVIVEFTIYVMKLLGDESEDRKYKLE